MFDMTSAADPFFLADGSTEAISRSLIWSLALIFSILALFAVVQLYRKWMNTDDGTTGPGFTLSDLRRLHKEGKMTAEEYEKAKVAIIGSLKASLEKPKVEPAGAKGAGLPPEMLAELRRMGELTGSELSGDELPGADASESKLSDRRRRPASDGPDSGPGPRTPKAN